MHHFPVVEIDWLDHYSLSREASIAELVKEARSDYLCKTVGYLIDETDTRVVLIFTQNTHDSNAEVMGKEAMVILKTCIVGRSEIRAVTRVPDL